MAINYSPKVGEILECDYGVFPTDANGQVDQGKCTSDGRIPPEMVKNRLVIVLNGRINNACVVVPMSSSQDIDKITRGWHITVDANIIPSIGYFTQKQRWAKADHVQQVSRKRLSNTSHHLPRDLVTEIQKAVLKVIGGASLLVAPGTSATTTATGGAGAVTPDPVSI